MNKRKYLSILTFLFFSIALVLGQKNSISYLSTNSEIANPERGWYDHYQTGDANYVNLDAQTLIKYRENDNITLILRMYYLAGFINQDSISTEYLENIQTDFNAARDAGVKCIVRFAYSNSQYAKDLDASPENVFSHIAYLSDVLNKNSDVIACVQAGFIGAWGEWYYTENFAGSGYKPSSEDQVNRRLLVEKLLNILPENIVVQSRTPEIMRNVVQSGDPISEAEAFNGSIKSRVGHHNDCFLANSTDYGTYENIEDDLAYLNQSTKYAISGGETCDASNSYSDCENSTSRVKLLHWTYLNRDYNEDVYEKWEEQECHKKISIGLGYRIVLDSASFSDTASLGGILKIDLSLKNVGFAAPTQYKPIKIILTHTESKVQATLNYSGINNDIRHWLPGKIRLIDEIAIPDTLIEGNYSLSMKLPDQNATLATNPAYSIRFANVGLWNNIKGTNSLNHIIKIGNNGVGELPSAPSEFTASAVSESTIQLHWASILGDETGFDIMRSAANANDWIFVTTLGLDATDYTDEDLAENTSYEYIIRAQNNYGSSNWSKSTSATTFNSTGINNNFTDRVQFYPTILHHENLKIKFSDNSKKTIRILSISGNVVYEKSTNQTRNEIDYTVFAPGVYVVVLNFTNEIQSRKLVVY